MKMIDLEMIFFLFSALLSLFGFVLVLIGKMPWRVKKETASRKTRLFGVFCLLSWPLTFIGFVLYVGIFGQITLLSREGQSVGYIMTVLLWSLFLVVLKRVFFKSYHS